MSERGEDFDQKREAYEAAREAQARLLDNPDKTIPVSEYRAKLEAAQLAVNAAHDAMLEAWSAPVTDEPNEFAASVAEVFAAAADGKEPWAGDARVIHVHHHDIENHARSFNEGYETAMAQDLADDPTTADDWLNSKLETAWSDGYHAALSDGYDYQTANPYGEANRS